MPYVPAGIVLVKHACVLNMLLYNVHRTQDLVGVVDHDVCLIPRKKFRAIESASHARPAPVHVLLGLLYS